MAKITNWKRAGGTAYDPEYLLDVAFNDGTTGQFLFTFEIGGLHIEYTNADGSRPIGLSPQQLDELSGIVDYLPESLNVDMEESLAQAEAEETEE